MMQELVDWFGNDFRVEKVGEGKIRARGTCNAKAMRFWALICLPLLIGVRTMG